MPWCLAMGLDQGTAGEVELGHGQRRRHCGCWCSSGEVRHDKERREMMQHTGVGLSGISRRGGQPRGEYALADEPWRGRRDLGLLTAVKEEELVYDAHAR